MGNHISRLMDYVGKRMIDIRKGSPRYRKRKKKWKNKRDIHNYSMIRGDEDYEDELYDMDMEGVQVVQL